MTTLRVYFDEFPDSGRDAEWALFGADDAFVRSGRGVPASWPAADAREAVIAATRGRLTTLKLPPLPVARTHAAVRYALEDQLAGAPEESHLATAPQAADGSVRVAIVADEWMRAFAAVSLKCGLRWRRALLESDLASPTAGGWCWCATSLAEPGFVCTDAGTSIAVGPARSDGVPEELAAALAGSGKRPRLIRVDADGFSADMRSRARQKTGIEFVAGMPWRWYLAGAGAWASAIDLQTGAYGPLLPSTRVDAARLIRPALWILACAFVFHALATAGQWAWLQWQSAKLERAMTTIARAAAPESTAAPTQAVSQKLAAVRHRAGLAADDDLLPLLARAAPALSLLPAGTVRSVRYADGHVLLELQKLDPARAARLQDELRRQGLIAIAAPTATGARLRIGID